MSRRKQVGAFALGLVLLLSAGLAQAAIGATNKVSDVRGTKHNLSSAADGSSTPSGGKVPTRVIKATSDTEVCSFCHTPHAAESISPGAPLWNRKLSTATYTPYTSSSMEANAAELAAAPGGSSKLCLSCHDGTMAIDTVNVLNQQQNATIAMVGQTSPVKMPSGSATTGFTRDIGVSLKNDHPISFTYSSTLATADGELRGPDANVANRVAGSAPPKLPLEDNQIQCATCHDPHLRDKTTGNGNAKFLRLNRFQVSSPTGNAFSPASDIICLACHNKGGASWAYSAHANDQVATQTYVAAAAQQREFPSTLDSPANSNPPVWQASCLNCHDTHTVDGARRLLREGTNSTASPKSGGSSAIEETCYQCHTTSAASVVSYTALTANAVPDIKTDFGLTRHMPIKSTEQAAGVEVHDIGGVFNDNINANCSASSGQCGKDFLESRALLGNGAGNLGNRHAECTDCHNPHRVVKFRDFRGNGGTLSGASDAAGTHPHTDTAMNHSNIASGVLRGSWGVEPTYGSASFHAMPSGYTVKRGDPGASATANVSDTYVTREYQICLKCHSDYGFSDNNKYDGTGNRPLLGSPGTPSGTNGLSMYTNIAKEFQAPSGHEGEPKSVGTAAGSSDVSARYNTNNHRSWHPVMLATGRNLTSRGMSGGNPWLAPWNNQVGSNTMYCTDCHGSNTSSETSVIPNNGDNGNPWGPHGSDNNFILKGVWGASMGATGRDSGYTANLLCFKCHDKANYTTRNDTGRKSGFYNSSRGNLHNYHIDKIQKLSCTWCHVAVPHGWKNKALLVNLNDVGEEAGQGAGSSKEVAINGSSGVFNKEPYYVNAKLKVSSFAASGSWSDTNCGSAGKSGTTLTGGIINGSGGSGNTTGTGINWMKTTCTSPP